MSTEKEKRTLGISKFQKLTNRKILLGVFALLICAVLIAVSSFVPFIINPAKWQTTEFLTDELIICAIVIFSMIATILIGQVSNAQNENSNLAKARTKFFATFDQITNISAFDQWVRKVLQPNDLQRIKERRLREIGIDDLTVLDLEYPEIRALLETPQKYNGKFYKGLSKEQIKEIINIKKGKGLGIHFVEPNYYLSVRNSIDLRTVSERSAAESKKKGMFLSKSVISRLLITIITAMIFASLMRDLTQEIDKATAWVKFVSRLWAMVSSAFMGYVVGCQINDIDAEYIEMRVLVHNMFLQDVTFKALTPQEEAKKEFVERVKEEQVLIEYKENVEGAS